MHYLIVSEYITIFQWHKISENVLLIGLQRKIVNNAIPFVFHKRSRISEAFSKLTNSLFFVSEQIMFVLKIATFNKTFIL